MTSVTNFVDVGDPGAPIGSPAWCRASHLRLCATKRQTDLEVRHLKYGLIEFKQKERWRQLHDNNQQPFRSWEDYVQYPEPNGLGIPPESVDAIMEALNDNSLLGEVLGGHGGDRRSLAKRNNITDQVRNTKLKTGTDTRDYILARLERDGFEELAGKVRTGEISANAAAIEAKYRKRVKRCPKCGHEW